MRVDDELKVIDQASKDLEARLEALVVGRSVCIASDWNGQPWGRSRPSMRGQTMVVERARLDPHWGIFLFLKGERCSIRAKEVEWL